MHDTSAFEFAISNNSRFVFSSFLSFLVQTKIPKKEERRNKNKKQMYEECDCDDCCPNLSLVGAQGMQGPDANGGDAIGPQGEQGFQSTTQFPQGMTGYQGINGSDNLRGDEGVQGFYALELRGLQGPDGFQGETSRGPQGNMGNIGAQGFDGSSNRGAQGFQGQNGSQGFLGMQGPSSYVGTQGPVGFQGVDGSWLNYFYASLGTQGPMVGTSSTLGTYPAPPVDSFFTFSCMAYGPQGTQGTFDVWQGTHTPANTLSSQPWEFPTYFATSDRIPFSVNVPISLFTNSAPVVVGFYSNPPGTFLNTDTSTFSFVQNATGRGKKQMESCEYTECDCDDCCERSQGPQGFIGYQGAAEIGPQGIRGYQMESFVHYGFQGQQGPQGSDIKGLQGFQGSQGDSAEGQKGPQGNQGALGVGPIGVAGIVGEQGPQGTATLGAQGDPGVVGALGQQGLRGPQGDAARDATGPQGFVGAPIVIAPFFNRGTQGFATAPTVVAFSQIVLPRGRYVDLMTVSITSTSACTGYVKLFLTENFSILSATGGTVCLTMQYTDYLSSLTTNVSWAINADKPVTLTWTRLILQANQ